MEELHLEYVYEVDHFPKTLFPVILSLGRVTCLQAIKATRQYVFSFVFVYSASGGELQMLLDRDEVPEEKQVKRLMRQILDGLVYLHSINVAHLDIKVRLCVIFVCVKPSRTDSHKTI